MTLKYVPIIDLEPYFSAGDSGKKQIAAQVDEACRDIGFLIVKNHRVPGDLIASMFRHSRHFFDQPLAAKHRIDQPNPDTVRGYSAVSEDSEASSLGEVTPGDLKESFSIGPIDVPNEDYYRQERAGPHFAANLWPNLPRFQETFCTYFSVMSDLSACLMEIFALSLGLDKHFFEPKIDKAISMLRVINYPNQDTDVEKNQMRAGAHTDFGSLTIVCPDQAKGGLQVQNADGEWIDVPYVEGGLVVNIGDLMMRWVNDQWISTIHRVVNPPRGGDESHRRISLVFFHQPNYDAVIDCIPSCLAAGAAPRYKPITSGDHLTAKFVKTTTFNVAGQA